MKITLARDKWPRAARVRIAKLDLTDGKVEAAAGLQGVARQRVGAENIKLIAPGMQLRRPAIISSNRKGHN